MLDANGNPANSAPNALSNTPATAPMATLIPMRM
jgi:hypothetical protein